MRLVNFFLLLLIWGQPALANNFFPKPTLVKIHAPQKNREEAYHYGYNGQMKVNEIAGVGNHNSALFWEYDTRTGKRWNLDPVLHPSESPYATFGGNPVWHNDVNGDDWKAEVAFALRHPLAAATIGSADVNGTNISSNAMRFSTRGVNHEAKEPILQLSKSHEGDQVNAFRHTLWQADIAKEFGGDMAKQAGDAHEDHPNALGNRNEAAIKTMTFKTLDAADEAADLSNNIIGRNIGTANKGADMKGLAQKTADEYHSNGLWTAQKQDDGTYKIDKTKITDKQYSEMSGVIKDVNNDARRPAEQNKINQNEIKEDGHNIK